MSCTSQPPVDSGNATATHALATIRTSCGCRRRENSQRAARPALRVTATLAMSNSRLLSTRDTNGVSISVWPFL